MTISQIKGMLKFARKAEKAYIRFGKTENAKQAHEQRVRLLAELKASRGK